MLNSMLLQDPVEVRIGQPEFVPQFSGTKRRLTEKWDTFQYIPLLSSLKQLLSDESIVEQVDYCPQRVHSDGILEDFCDGDRFSSHPVFSQDPYALQIIAYYDELEICNPLGSHIKTRKCFIL